MKYVIITTKNNKSKNVCHHVVDVEHYKMYGEDSLDRSCEIRGIRSFVTNDFKKALKKLDELTSLNQELNSTLISAETFEKLKRKSEFNKFIKTLAETRLNDTSDEVDDQVE